MMSKHTPGPWRVSDTTHMHPVAPTLFITRKPTDGVSETHIAKIHPLNGGDSIAEVAANARLIAAAPDMLKALEDLFEHCAMVHKHWGVVAI